MLDPIDVYRLDINSRWLGISTDLLMENAGKNVADIVEQKYRDATKIVCICSRTNNGGDGLVAARHLSMSRKVTVLFIGRPELIRTPETRKNWEIINRLHSVRKVIIKNEEDLPLLENILSDADLVIDAIFGIGIRGKPRGLEARVIETLNKLKKQYGFKVVSVDVPSGFDCYRGERTEITVEADTVVTFHDLKKGLDKLRADLYIRGIGIPRDAEIFVGPGDLLDILRPRHEWSHKGDFGKILIIGGSKYFTGAPALAGLSALRSGADLVVIYAPEAIANTIRSFSPNLIVWQYEGEKLNELALENLPGIINKFDTIIIGPGIGADDETIDTAHNVICLASQHKPTIIDADALKSIAKHGIPKGDIIITPHAGEFKLIFNVKPTTDIDERANLVIQKAKEYRITILLKGHIDIISNGIEVKLNRTGNPGMTVGGTGDVLTGVIAYFRSLGLDSFRSACSAAFVCGYAGDLAYEKYGYQLLATDVIDFLPTAIERTKEFIYGPG